MRGSAERRSTRAGRRRRRRSRTRARSEGPPPDSHPGRIRRPAAARRDQSPRSAGPRRHLPGNRRNPDGRRRALWRSVEEAMEDGRYPNTPALPAPNPAAFRLAPADVLLRVQPPLLRASAWPGGAPPLRDVGQRLERRPESLEGPRPVHELAPPLGRRDRQAGGRVDEPDRRGGLVPVLAARSAGHEAVHLAVGQQRIVVLGQCRPGGFPPSALFGAVHGGSRVVRAVTTHAPTPCTASASRAPAPTTSRASASSSSQGELDRRHRRLRGRQEQPRRRHPLRRGPAPLRRELQPVRAAVPRAARAAADGQRSSRSPRASPSTAGPPVKSSRSTVATMADLEPYFSRALRPRGGAGLPRARGGGRAARDPGAAADGAARRAPRRRGRPHVSGPRPRHRGLPRRPRARCSRRLPAPARRRRGPRARGGAAGRGDGRRGQRRGGRRPAGRSSRAPRARLAAALEQAWAAGPRARRTHRPRRRRRARRRGARSAQGLVCPKCARGFEPAAPGPLLLPVAGRRLPGVPRLRPHHRHRLGQGHPRRRAEHRGRRAAPVGGRVERVGARRARPLLRSGSASPSTCPGAS